MAVYEYKGFDSRGKAVNGIVDADSPRTARLKLRKSDVFPTELIEEKLSRRLSIKRLSISTEISWSTLFERITVQDVAMITRQLATLLGAGITLVESLSALIDQVDKRKLKTVISSVREKVNEGSSLADALKEHPKVFSDLYINMINAGETSGALDIVLLRLADFTESQVQNRNKINSVMYYPIFMLFIAVGMVILMFTFVIPKITQIFEDIDAILPLPTKILISTSHFVRSYWGLVTLVLIIAAVYLLKRYIKTPPGRERYDAIMLRLPVFGALIRMIAVARFSKTLSTLLSSGIPLLKSFDIVKTVVNNQTISQAIEASRESITEGASIAEPLKRSGQFPPLVTHMIAVGERSGELEGMLMKVSEAYESEVETKLGALTSLMEPAMILLMAVGVGFIIFSILLPIFQMNQIMVQ